MFFIFGIDTKERRIDYNQTVICKLCGKYGRYEVFMTYMCFSLFFIPIIKWNRKYFIRMSCCGSICEISHDLGRAIERGNVTEIDQGTLDFGRSGTNIKKCPSCGYVTREDFVYCPKCGRMMQ